MIIVCEPQSIGFVHAEVNSAMLSVIAHAYPEERITFLGGKEHLDIVKKNLEDRGVTGIEYVPIKIPKQNFRNYKRFIEDLIICRNALELAAKNGTRKVIFTSVTSSCVVSLKILLRLYRHVDCLVVTHDIMEKILKAPSMLPVEAPFWFRLILPAFNTKRLRYLVLGEPIKENLSRILPRVDEYVDAIDMPYFFCPPESLRPLPDGALRFGAFGVGALGKGTDRMFKLARDVKNKADGGHEFVLIGQIVDRTVREMVDAPGFAATVPSPDKPLSREDFDRLARSVHYAIFLYDPHTYRLTASGALFDAFSYVTPVIAIRNTFFEYYFKALGDIGYLCEDVDEVERVVLDIINDRPAERYLAQKRNILEARKRFDHALLGARLREIIEKGFDIP